MISILPLILTSTAAFTQPIDLSTAAILTLDLSAQSQPADIDTTPVETSQRSVDWGTIGSWRWGVQTAYAEEIKQSSNTIAVVSIEFEYFVEDRLSIDLGFHFLDVDQLGEDASGLNATLLLRWHFLNEQTWSMFMEAGAGFMRADANIPTRGSQLNFTPQAGFGFSFDIGQHNRWLIGLRWHHISNANMYDRNPGRDSVMLWTGISIPF